MRSHHVLRVFLGFALLALMVAAPVGAGGTVPPPDPGSWSWSHPKPQGDMLTAVSFANANEGWAVGNSGTVVHTVDGGVSWQEQQSTTATTTLWAVDAVDATHVWAVGDSGLVIKTSDGGATWTEVEAGTTNSLYGIAFASATHGFACGSGVMRETTDGGQTWHAATVTSDPPGFGAAVSWMSVAFDPSGTFGTAVSSEPAAGTALVMHTHDGGATWHGHASGLGLPADAGVWLRGVAYGSSSEVWAVGSVPAAPGSTATIRHSNDGGSGWSPQTTTITVTLNSVAFADANNGWAVGDWGQIIHTTDGGTTWTQQPTPALVSPVGLRGVAVAGSRPVAVGVGGVTLTTTNAGTTWTARDQSWAGRVYDISFGTANDGWAVGDDGTIMHTANAGGSWTRQTSGLGSVVSGVKALDANHAWAVGWSGRAVYTEDAGAHWSSKLATTSLYDVTFADAGNGWVSGTNGKIAHTSDGGLTWKAQPSTLTTPGLWNIEFADALHGFASGQDGWIAHTDDGGQTWASTIVPLASSPMGTYLYDMDVVDANNAWVVGSGGAIYHTSNGGTSWSPQASGFTRELDAVAFTDAKHGWVAGLNGALAYTNDGGATWVPQDGLPTPGWLIGAAFTDQRHGWLCGYDGMIVKFQPETVAPVTSMLPEPAGWRNADFAFQLSATDNGGSGVAKTQYCLMPADSYLDYAPGSTVTVSREGTTVVQYLSVDDIGNPETPKTANVLIDKTPPVTSCDATGTYGGPITARLTAVDPLSGVASVRYSLDGGTWATGTSVEVKAAGTHTLKYASTDAAGNAEAEKTATFKTLATGGTPGAAVSLPVAGPTRIDTAIKASQAAFGAADAVVIATAFNFPDALGGSSLAGALNAPLLLTNKDALPAAVEAEIARLGAKKAYILGSEAAVGAGVANRLGSLLSGSTNVERIGGADRYATAALIAKKTVDTIGAASFDGTVFVATGENFPDALAASPIAAAKRRPILLTRGAALPDVSATALGTLQVRKALILGSTSAVSEGVAGAVRGKVADVSRLAGASRYQTAIAVARAGVADGLKWDGVALATGTNYPDALAGGVMCGRLGSVMLLTDPTALTPDVKAELVTNKATIGTVRFLGSTSAVTQAVRDAVSAALK